MKGTRYSGVPVGHILAEMVAFPLASESSFRLGVVELDPKLKDSSADLWRAAEATMLGHSAAFTVDETLALRDYTWFHGVLDKPQALSRYLQRIARSYLALRGPSAIPSVPLPDHLPLANRLDDRDARRLWRWLTFSIPSDLLLAARAEPHQPLPDLDVLTPALSNKLHDSGFAEVHLHVGSAIDFPVLWVATLRTLGMSSFSGTEFQSPGALFEHGRELGYWLLSAAITRYLLGAFLYEDTSKVTFVEFLTSKRVRSRLGEIGPIGMLMLRDALRGISGGVISDWINVTDLRGLYTTLVGGSWESPIEDIGALLSLDPIAPFAGPKAAPGDTAETWWIRAGLSHLKSNAAHQDTSSYLLFKRLFWQTIRVRCLYYRHIVLRPMTPGLQWFIRTFARLSPAKRLFPMRARVGAAAHVCGIDHGLRSLEIRTAPPSDQSEMVRLIDEIDKAGNALTKDRDRKIELGVVFHFVRDRGGGALRGVPAAHGKNSEDDPGSPQNATGYRFSGYYTQKRVEALQLSWLLCSFPRAIELVRGIDVCTDELGVPLWVIAPLIRYVSDAANVASAHVSSPERRLPPFRTTPHAGEDFVHMLGGLRRIEETVRHFRLGAGDRLGHGLALGVDAHAWADGAGLIGIPREERLLDLVWAWSWHGRHGGQRAGERAIPIEREIAVLSERIFGQTYRCVDLETLVFDLYDERMLRYVGFPDGAPWFSPDDKDCCRRLRLLYDYLTNAAIFRRGREIEWIDPSGEAELLAEVQSGLRQQIASLGIALEVNPSSNLLIGNLGDLERHPLWRLNKPGATESTAIPIVIGSDNPTTFATTLREEYMLLHDALIQSGYSEEQVARWLNAARRNGLDYRFTLPYRGDVMAMRTSGLEHLVMPIL